MQIQAVSPAQYNPYSTPFSNASLPAYPGSTGSSAFSSDYTNISSMVAHGGGGGFVAYKFGDKMANDMRSIVGNGFKGGLIGIKNTAITGLKGAGVGALVSAGVSLVANGVGTATGKVDSSQAVSNVITDTLSGGMAGLVGVASGGWAQIAMAGIGVTGLAGSIVSVSVGVAGGVIGGQLGKRMAGSFS